nr:hypothetical protein [Tanacetum cinerariifolium]
MRFLMMLGVTRTLCKWSGQLEDGIMLCPVLVTGIGFPSPMCTDGNKRVLKSVLKLFELEFKWEEAAVSMFHVGSCKVIVLKALGAGHDGLVGKIGPDDGLVHKQWLEIGLFGAVVGL